MGRRHDPHDDARRVVDVEDHDRPAEAVETLRVEERGNAESWGEYPPRREAGMTEAPVELAWGIEASGGENQGWQRRRSNAPMTERLALVEEPARRDARV
jgi:hypothetical protein